MEAEQDERFETDPRFAEMKAKTEAVYKAFQQAHQAMRSASRAIDELQAVMPQELSTFGPPPQHYPSPTSNYINRKHAKSTSGKSLSARHSPYTKPNILPAPPQSQNTAAANMTSTISPTKRSRGGGPRSPGKHQTSVTGTTRREPPEFTPEQAELLDEFIKYFNLRVEGTNIPQWKIGAEISEFAGNSIKMDQSTVSRMARRLGVPKSQTGVEAVKKWISNEKQRLSAAATTPTKNVNAPVAQVANAQPSLVGDGNQNKQTLPLQPSTQQSQPQSQPQQQPQPQQPPQQQQQPLPPPPSQQQPLPTPPPQPNQELPTQPSLEAVAANGSEKKD